MLDLPRLKRIRLMKRPIGQVFFGHTVLTPNYKYLPGIDIQVEGIEKIPNEPVIYAMNHTDRFNYFPFMYRMWKLKQRFMTVWVKGKNYESPFVGTFMELTSNLPTVSRGYIITKDFTLTMERRPTQAEYDALRALVNKESAPGEDPGTVDVSAVPEDLFKIKRKILGIDFDPSECSYAVAVNRVFAAMMVEFVRLNERSFELGLDLLVFPQGTRSIRLPRGRIGMMQVALRYKKTIVPIGCNGSDLVYTRSLPIGKSGTIVYRVGDPIRYEDLSDFHIDEDYAPFSMEAEHTHRDKFQGAVDVVMDRINDLLDPEYQFSDDLQSTGVRRTSPFL
ncbi:MAG: 1-acyl-sn-glycerol-3-phosphate acyltransferase [Deltaproteobacteria bacterium]|nr:1-acyl-sn-glycerol-3-phosphate acyltransferase [Deltaproteobacteria bacterium]MBW2375743.1 1-acyl-sn-glycerol-3-phosphate acyltransferase [Deltaproteobacteria bacterium]MBW2586907.1 1-acyl-sn-glycerol-3-phosphate acyltransferase [Deltaproteobacteria bacterium]